MKLGNGNDSKVEEVMVNIGELIQAGRFAEIIFLVAPAAL